MQENNNEIDNDNIAAEPEDIRSEHIAPVKAEMSEADAELATVSPAVESYADTTIGSEQPLLISAHAQSNNTKKWVMIGGIVAVLMILLAGGIWWTLRNNQGTDSSSTTQSATIYPQGAALTSIEGTVEVNTGDGWITATSGTNLEQGDQLRTAKNSRAIVTLDEGSAIRLDASSSVAFTTLNVGGVTVDNQSGSVYTRVVASESRTFVVTIGNVPYRAMGTAYMTVNRSAQKGVEVFESTVTTKDSKGTDKEVAQGEAFYIKDKDASDVDKVKKLDLEKLKKNTFLKWNKQQDEKDEKFANKLGVLKEIDKPAETEKEADTEEKPNTAEPTVASGISAWGVKTDDGVKMSWSVKGINTEDGFKVTYSNSDTTPSYGENSAQYVSAGTSSVVLGLTDGKTWHVRVCAYRGDGKCDSYSNTVSVTAPYKETVKVTRGTMSVNRSGNTLSWSYSGKAVYGYKIVWNTSGNPTYPISGEKSGYKYLSSQSASSLNLSEAISEPGNYYLRVCAYTGGTQSEACVDYGSAAGKYTVD